MSFLNNRAKEFAPTNLVTVARRVLDQQASREDIYLLAYAAIAANTPEPAPCLCRFHPGDEPGCTYHGENGSMCS
jgi:hypothetical protein